MKVRSSKELGEAVRVARKTRKLSQTELAQKASLRQALISDVENGVTSAKLDTILKVMAALDLDLAVVERSTDSFDPMDY